MSREIRLVQRRSGRLERKKEKKNCATKKSRVTNGVNSSTRNSLIGVPDISFRGCMERGGKDEAGEREERDDGLGHENHQLDHCPPSVPL